VSNVDPLGLEVMGHEDTLAKLLEVRSSSLLLVGPEGVGRRRAARWLAAVLNCRAERQDRPCGACDSCSRFDPESYGTHPDYREVTGRATTSSGRRSPRPEIRIGQLVPRPGEDDPLSRWLEQRPAFRRRVGVIDGAHRLTSAAANSFLKVLEEPPSYATIVLIAPSARAVLPTIASRCAILRFGTVDTGALGRPGHPAHRLGRPGPLLAPPPSSEENQEAVDGFVEALHGDLEAALSAADALAGRWQEPGGSEIAEMLRERFRALPQAARVRADDQLLECEEAIAGYAPATLALRLFALELRAAPA
jgi:DNA polymerase-3 subunit delta'